MNKFIISAIVCAGGLSKRMGSTNKVLLPYNGKVILSHVVEQLLESNVSEVIVVLGHDFEKAKNALDIFGEKIKVTFNASYLLGQTSSIQSGISVLDPHAQAFMICLADMPLLSCRHINELIEFYQEKSNFDNNLITRPVVNKRPGHPVIMHQTYRQEILDCTDTEGCRSVIARAKPSFLPFKTKEQAFITDIDTPDLYENLMSKSAPK